MLNHVHTSHFSHPTDPIIELEEADEARSGEDDQRTTCRTKMTVNLDIYF